MKALLLQHSDSKSESFKRQLSVAGLEVKTPSDLIVLSDTLRKNSELSLVFIDWSLTDAGTLVKKLRKECEPSELTIVAILPASQPAELKIEGLLSSGFDDVIRAYEGTDKIATRLELIKKRVLVTQAAFEARLVQERYAKYLERRVDENLHQLIHADRLATLGTMAAGVAHEVRTPLSSVVASEEIAREALESLLFLAAPQLSGEVLSKFNAKVKIIQECLGRVERGGVRINSIVETLRLFSKTKTKGNRTICKVSDIIDSALQVAASRTKNQVQISAHGLAELPSVEVDPLQLEQVFVNMVVNGAEAMSSVPNAQITIRGSLQANTVVVFVEDNGPGLPAELLHGEIKQFFTTKGEGGTGLGLFISRNIVRSHGGELSLSNRPEGGARFEVSLPLHKIVDEENAPRHEQPSVSAPMKI